MPYNLYWQGLWDVEYRDKSISLPGSCTGVFILPHILSFGANRFRCSTITCGSFRRAKVSALLLGLAFETRRHVISNEHLLHREKVKAILQLHVLRLRGDW